MLSCYTLGVDSGTETRAVKTNWYRRIFNWLTRHETPPGIDPETHRKALWAAFVFCTAAFTVSTFVSILSSSLLLNFQPLWEKLTFLHTDAAFKALESLQHFEPGEIFNALLIAFLVYAIVLRLHGEKLPASVMDLVVTAAFASLILKPLGAVPPDTGYGFILIPALFALVLYLRGHLRDKNTRLLMILATIYMMLSATVGAVLYRLMTASAAESSIPSASNYFLTASTYAGFIYLPLAIMLPIAMLASARTPAPPTTSVRKPSGFSPSDIFLGIIVLLALIYAVSTVWLQPIEYRWALGLLSGFTYAHAGILYVLLALTTFALLYSRVSTQFRVFMVCALCLCFLKSHFVFYLRWIPLDTAAPEMIIMGLGALWLATKGKLNRAKLFAAALILLNSNAIAIWMSLEKPVQRAASLYKDAAPVLVGLKLGAYEMVLLALVPAMLMLAWWFIEPDDVAAMFRRQA